MKLKAKESFSYTLAYFFGNSADPDGLGPDPDPKFKKNRSGSGSDPTFKKNPDPHSQPCNLVFLFLFPPNEYNVGFNAS